jgi:hypothetical protein
MDGWMDGWTNRVLIEMHTSHVKTLSGCWGEELKKKERKRKENIFV